MFYRILQHTIAAAPVILTLPVLKLVTLLQFQLRGTFRFHTGQCISILLRKYQCTPQFLPPVVSYTHRLSFECDSKFLKCQHDRH